MEQKNLWVDVVIKDGDVECDWNKTIFFENDADDMSIKAFQEDLSNFEDYTDVAVNFLQKVGLIEQNDDATWYVVEFELEDGLYFDDEKVLL